MCGAIRIEAKSCRHIQISYIKAFVILSFSGHHDNRNLLAPKYNYCLNEKFTAPCNDITNILSV